MLLKCNFLTDNIVLTLIHLCYLHFKKTQYYSVVDKSQLLINLFHFFSYSIISYIQVKFYREKEKLIYTQVEQKL